MSKEPLIEFVRSYREPTDIKFVAQELERLGRMGGDWPRASVSEWIRRLRELVKDGLLLERDGVLSIPKQTRIVQKTLF